MCVSFVNKARWMVCCVPWTGVCIPLYLAMTARGRRGRGGHTPCSIPSNNRPSLFRLAGPEPTIERDRQTSKQDHAGVVKQCYEGNIPSRTRTSNFYSRRNTPPYHTSTTHSRCGALSSAGVTSPSAARSSQNGAQLPPRKGLATAASKPFRYTDTGFLSADL
jgi:hypothetical protein